jgi:two-component system sensor histidine kinase HydH
LNQLVENFLQHGKAPSVTLREQPPAPLLRDVVRLAEQKAREQGIACRAEFPDDLPVVLIDEVQLKSCLMNVVLNAIQAMPEGGVLTVVAESAPAEHGGGNGATDGPGAAGWLEIRVRDTGHGISPEELERVCDPYFTTKPLGIGLGLSLTKRILEEHGGMLQVASELGRGTVITLRLPLMAGPAGRSSSGSLPSDAAAPADREQADGAVGSRG